MILDKIAAYTRLRIEEAKKELSPDEIRRLALSCKTDTGFPFEKVLKEPGIHYICEVKKSISVQGSDCRGFPLSEDCRRIRKGRCVGNLLPYGTKVFHGKECIFERNYR